MKQSNLKNIVVLKNLPSNIVDEAIVILKTNKMTKKVQKVENSKSIKKEEVNNNQEEYILKEAEMLINSYVDKVEKSKSIERERSTQIKYTKLKNYAYVSTLLMIIEGLIIFAK